MVSEVLLAKTARSAWSIVLLRISGGCRWWWYLDSDSRTTHAFCMIHDIVVLTHLLLMFSLLRLQMSTMLAWYRVLNRKMHGMEIVYHILRIAEYTSEGI